MEHPKNGNTQTELATVLQVSYIVTPQKTTTTHKQTTTTVGNETTQQQQYQPFNMDLIISSSTPEFSEDARSMEQYFCMDVRMDETGRCVVRHYYTFRHPNTNNCRLTTGSSFHHQHF